MAFFCSRSAHNNCIALLGQEGAAPNTIPTMSKPDGEMASDKKSKSIKKTHYITGAISFAVAIPFAIVGHSYASATCWLRRG